jgi:hypothetical protein
MAVSYLLVFGALKLLGAPLFQHHKISFYLLAGVIVLIGTAIAPVVLYRSYALLIHRVNSVDVYPFDIPFAWVPPLIAGVSAIRSLRKRANQGAI